MKKFPVCLVGLLALGVAGKLAADVLISGGGGQINQDCVPFGCSLQSQEIIDKSLFSGPITINKLTFFNNTGSGTFDPATYTFKLSTTSASVGSPSGVFAANVGPDEQVFTTTVIPGGPIPASFSFTGVPFHYDPALGNLLIEIDKPDSANTFSGFTDNNSNFSGVSRVWSLDNSGVGNVNTGYAPVVQIGTESVIPEPATLTLAGLGFLGLVGYGARKRRPAATAKPATPV
jgi:hypothetical protein